MHTSISKWQKKPGWNQVLWSICWGRCSGWLEMMVCNPRTFCPPHLVLTTVWPLGCGSFKGLGDKGWWSWWRMDAPGCGCWWWVCFLTCEIVCTFFFFLSFFLLFPFQRRRWLARTNVTLLGQRSVHSDSASWDDWTSVPWRVACELVSRMGFRTLLVQHSQLTPTSLGHLSRVCVFSCYLPPALLAEWLGVFNMLLRITGGRMNTEIRASTENWLWRRKFHRRSCRTRDLLTTIPTLPLSYNTGLVWMLARLLKRITY